MYLVEEDFLVLLIGDSDGVWGWFPGGNDDWEAVIDELSLRESGLTRNGAAGKSCAQSVESVAPSCEAWFTRRNK